MTHEHSAASVSLVLAGGASSRFFPVNKVFADPTGSGRSLLQFAYDRVAGDPGDATCRAGDFFVVTGPEFADRVRAELPIDAAQVFIEPARRNTFPAILWACAHLATRSNDAVVTVLTADHVIDEHRRFRAALRRAADLVNEGPAIATIGIEPSNDPEEWTAYGAILSEDTETGALRAFEEKPVRERAAAMLREGGWVWNSGMFVFRVSTLEGMLKQFQPEMAGTYQALVEALRVADGDRAAIHFRSLPAKIPHPQDPSRRVDNSIDFALMMPLALDSKRGFRAYTVRGRFPWSDLGTWDALREVVDNDGAGNIEVGDIECTRVRDSILVAEPGRSIVAEGISGCVVVAATDGPVLVAREARARELKQLVERVRSEPALIVCEDCGPCIVQSDGSRVALFGVTGVSVEVQGPVVEIRSLPRGTGIQPQRPALKHYAWGGDALSSLDRHGEVGVAEAWMVSSYPGCSSTLLDGDIGLDEWCDAYPEGLGDWSRRFFGDTLPVLTKLLSSRFPPRVHAGLRAGFGTDPPDTRRRLLRWLQKERAHLREFYTHLDPERFESEERFNSFKTAYEGWAVEQATNGWREERSTERFVRSVEPFVKEGRGGEWLAGFLKEVRENRAEITGAFNEVDLEQAADAGHMMLIPAGLPHALFGLSHQFHPRDDRGSELAKTLGHLRRAAGSATASDAGLAAMADSFAWDPSAENAAKNEAWLPFRLGSRLVTAEVQQTSDVTFSFADMFTPWVWKGPGVVFRKGDPETGVSDRALDEMFGQVSTESVDADTLIRRTGHRLVEVSTGDTAIAEVIDDPALWPYFSVYRGRLAGKPHAPARWKGAPPDGAFQQILVLRGRLLLLERGGRRVELTPHVPAFVPAGTGVYEIQTDVDAEVLFVSIPTPRKWIQS